VVLAGLREIADFTGLSLRETRREVMAGRIPARLVAGKWLTCTSLCSEWKKRKIEHVFASD
jgi:hypothetical protein